MDKNIFIKNKKYNPDVAKNYSKTISDRDTTKFTFKDEFINPDIVNKDKTVYNVDKESAQMDLLIKQRLQERNKQEFDFKPSKNTLPTSNPNDFKEFSDLKVQQTNYEDKQSDNNNNFNSILDDLKDLGILK